MNTRTLFATFAIPATAVGLFAQDNLIIEKKAAEAVMLAQGPVGMVGLSAEPGNVRFMTQEFSFSGRPVTNQPYSAEEKTESVQTLADGTKIINSNTAKMYRDSQGRTRREMTLPGFNGDAPAHTMITISDPVAGVNYTLQSNSRTAHKMPGLITTVDIRGEIGAKIRAEADAHVQEMKSGTASSTMEYRVIRKSGPAAGTKREDLPGTMLEGVNVTGTRETSIIEAGAMGNDRPITISSERWYSPELQTEIKSVRSDPRMGVTTHTLSNISRSEPDAALFQVPSDYKLIDPKTGPGMQTFEYHTTTDHKF